MLGLFDSGLGGLTVLRELRALLPAQDVLFFADQAHVPYGDKSVTELRRLLEENIEFMNAAGVDAIVMACNTSCAIAAQDGWPPSQAPILDLIDAAADAVEHGGYTRIGVIATTVTARSGSYARKIRQRIPGATVAEIAAPALVPLVEAGKLHGSEPRAAVEEVCRQLPAGTEAVILACTHYPLLDAHFAAVLGEGVVRIDPAVEQAKRAAFISEKKSREALKSADTITRCVTNADLEKFRTNVAAILGPLASNATYERI